MNEVDTLETLTKDERIALLNSPWKVEKHEMDDGYITWEIWCYRPYWRVCSVSEDDNPYAKLCVDRIVADHFVSLSDVKK